MKQKTIYLCILNQGEIRTDLAQVINLIIQNDSYRIYLTYPTSKPITNNRNTIVQKFLASDADYLMMIDDDIIPPPNILNLVDFDKDIATPLMFVKQKGTLLPLFLKRNKDGIYDVDDYMNKVGMQEADATGTGCIVIKREVCEKMKHLFRNEYDEDGIKTLGNDLSFCQRAKELGFRIWVHLDYVADHHYTDSLREEYYTQLKMYKIEKELHLLKQALKSKPYLNKIMFDVNEKMLAK